MPALNSLLKTCYEYDLIERSRLFGVQHPTVTFPRKFIVQLISACDDLSGNPSISQIDKRRIITALGILWDNCNKEFQGIRIPIMTILSRLGYLPNTSLFTNEALNLSRMDSFAIQSNRILNSSITQSDGRIFFTSLQGNVWSALNLLGHIPRSLLRS